MSDYRAERAAHLEPVNLVITTRVPSKWRFADLETGDIWRSDGTQMVRARDQVLLPSDTLAGRAIAETVADLRQQAAELQDRLFQVQAAVRLLFPDEMTPNALRTFNRILDPEQ
jgi:hypothetical protein